ncbi:hypothetical protein B0J14DRAFT_671900 [Halenospora varia]|nr:hypothetical protein B0J14DRAFT_671900 [Halenospora varia]
MGALGGWQAEWTCLGFSPLMASSCWPLVRGDLFRASSRGTRDRRSIGTGQQRLRTLGRLRSARSGNKGFLETRRASVEKEVTRRGLEHLHPTSSRQGCRPDCTCAVLGEASELLWAWDWGPSAPGRQEWALVHLEHRQPRHWHGLVGLSITAPIATSRAYSGTGPSHGALGSTPDALAALPDPRSHLSIMPPSRTANCGQLPPPICKRALSNGAHDGGTARAIKPCAGCLSGGT